jgi:hypothetical protein
MFKFYDCASALVMMKSFNQKKPAFSFPQSLVDPCMSCEPNWFQDKVLRVPLQGTCFGWHRKMELAKKGRLLKCLNSICQGVLFLIEMTH